MKLTDFLQDVGRPVAYYPELRKITGSTNATILLCQFIYWRGKESDPEGWLYKTSYDIQNETGLSYGEQKTARRDLVEAGLLDEHYARLDHQMKFKLNLEVINDKWGKPQTDIPESGKPQFGNEGNPLSLNESENTTEIEKPAFDEELADIGWTIHAGKKITKKQLFKQSEMKAFDDMLDAQFRRLRLNFSAFDEKAKEAFRRFIRTQPKDQTLERFVSWWLEDEWRAANPPYTLGVIMQRWLQAFTKHTDETKGSYTVPPTLERDL